jgi:hypothetical protein
MRNAQLKSNKWLQVLRMLFTDRRSTRSITPQSIFAPTLPVSLFQRKISGFTSTHIRASHFVPTCLLFCTNTNCEVIVYPSQLSHNRLQYRLYWWNYCPSRRQSIILIIHALLALTSSSGNNMTRKGKYFKRVSASPSDSLALYPSRIFSRSLVCFVPVSVVVMLQSLCVALRSLFSC